MKKLFTLILFLIVFSVYSQDISSPKPILKIENSGNFDTDIPTIGNIMLGCGTTSVRIQANWSENLGSTDEYTVEQIPYSPKGYLPLNAGTPFIPSGYPGEIVVSPGDLDDSWGTIQQLESNGTPFKFCFYNESKTEFVVSGNAIVSFDNTYAGYSGWDLRAMGAIQPNGMCGDNKDAILQIHDTNPSDGDVLADSYIFWTITGTQGERYFTLGTHHMPMYNCGNSVGYATHQMVFYETTNIIEFHIQDKPLCMTWPPGNGGLQAFGLQNKDGTNSIAVPGLDNGSVPREILDLTDGFYDGNFDGTQGTIDGPVSYRFTPIGAAATAPEFTWYSSWTGDPTTSTVYSNDAILSVDQSDVPATNLTFTAVIDYAPTCGGDHFYATQEVTLELSNPLEMFIKENDSTDDTVEFISEEEINLCEGEDYLLEAIIQNDDAPVYTDIRWIMRKFGDSPIVVNIGDTTYTIPDNLVPGNYVFTCTITDGATCVFSDTVAVDIFDDATSFNYPGLKVFCRSDNDIDATPVATSIHPTAPAGTTDTAVLEEYYFTVDNGGVWLNSLAADATRSLDGTLDLSASLDAAAVTNADGSANFVITYHAHCPDNTATDTIVIKNAPDVVKPIFKDLTATPPITDNNALADLITLCGNSAFKATFDIVAIENEISNGISGLNFVWVSNTGGVPLSNPMPSTLYTQTLNVTVTVDDGSATSCPVDIIMKLDVVPPVTIVKPTDNNNGIHLNVCEIVNTDPDIHIAAFDIAAIETEILNGQLTTDGYEIKYYNDATSTTDINATITAGINTAGEFESPTTTLFVEVVKGDCKSSRKEFELTVIDRLEYTNPTNIVLCETDSVNHTASFDTTGWSAAILASNPTPVTATDYKIIYEYTNLVGTIVTINDNLPNPLPSVTQTITVKLINETYIQTCSNQFNLNLIVKATPVGTPDTIKVCSTQDTAINNVNLDLETDYVSLTDNTFKWYAVENTNVTGQTNIDPTNIDDASPIMAGVISESLYNTTEVPQTVIYHVVPTSQDTSAAGDPSNACKGNEFIITVIIYPEPVVENYNATIGIKICSSEVVHILEDASNNPIPLNLDEIVTLNNNTYTWYAEDNANVDGETLSASTSNIINDVLINTNTTDIEETVVYHITPTSEDTSAVSGGHTSCSGKEIIIEVKIGFAPVITNQTEAACSGNTDVIADFNTTKYTDLTGNTYTWYASIPNSNVTGISIATAASPETTSTIDDDLVLVAGVITPQTVVYDVTPTSGCVGASFTVTVTVNPLPEELATLPTPIETCSLQQDETTFNVDLDINDYVTLANNTFEWYAEYPLDVTGFITNVDNTNVSNLTEIKDRITNISNGNQTITYHIIPTSANTSATGDPSNACSGAEITIDVIIYPEPIQQNYDANTVIGICSGDIVHDTTNNPLQLDYYTTLSTVSAHPNSYTWYADANTDVGGISTATAAAPETSNIITDVLINNHATGMDSTVTYHITPTSDNGCKGKEYILEVIVSSKPVGTGATEDICSGEQVSMLVNNIKVDLDLDAYTTFVDNGDGENHNTYKWKALDNPDVSGETLTEVVTDDINTIIDDVLINNTSSIKSVIYEITPSSAGSCEGDMFFMIINIGFAPVITDQNETFCHDTTLSINIDDYTTLIGNEYKWQAINNDNVTGESTLVTNSPFISDVIINTTGVQQIVEYQVLPFSAGKCQGNLFSIFVAVDPRPDFELQPQYFICPEITKLNIGEDSNPDNYNYKWYMANNTSAVIGYSKLLEVTISNLIISGGTYILEVEDPATGCTYSQFTTVSVAEQMAVAQIHVSDFNRPENSIIIEMVGGSGEFEYTLSHIDFEGNQQSITQSSPIFENLVAGTYQIEVVDSTACSINVISQDIYILDYPQFFTPNGDTVNDTWKISGANLIPDSKIYVFDRYGKVLAQLDPTDYLGWDGTYNGVQVPASDYWFSAQYLDPNTGKQKSVKGHFSIVRK